MGDVGDGLFEKFLGFMFRFVLRIEGHGQLVSPGEHPIEGARLVSGKPDAEVSGSEFGEDICRLGIEPFPPRKMEKGDGQQDGSQQHSADTKGQEPGRALICGGSKPDGSVLRVSNFGEKAQTAFRYFGVFKGSS